MEPLTCVGFPGYAVDVNGNIYNLKTLRKLGNKKTRTDIKQSLFKMV